MDCLNCGKEIDSKKKFCDRSCAATYSNKKRTISEETKLKISISLKNAKLNEEVLNEDLIITDYNNGILQKDICSKYNIGTKALRTLLINRNVYKKPIPNKGKVCEVHNEEYTETNAGRYICKKCQVERVTKSRQALKLKAIAYKGGCCVKCSYDKCVSALEFHHENPEVKEFGICETNIKDWDLVKEELDKCILVCSNCHREIHEELRNKDKGI